MGLPIISPIAAQAGLCSEVARCRRPPCLLLVLEDLNFLRGEDPSGLRGPWRLVLGGVRRGVGGHPVGPRGAGGGLR